MGYTASAGDNSSSSSSSSSVVAQMAIAGSGLLVGTGSGTLLLDITSASVDTDSAVDTGSDRWTCPADGTYVISLNGMYYAIDQGTNPDADISIRVNGTAVTTTGVLNGTNGTNAVMKVPVSLTYATTLSSGDYVDFYLSNIQAGGWSYFGYSGYDTTATIHSL